MSQGANVRSVDAIKDFKVTLINFAEEAKNALSSSDMEIRQVRNWLLRDQLSHWQSQVKRGQQRVSMARTELHRRQLSQANSDAVSDTEQKESLRDALRGLHEAEEKVEKIKRWVPLLENAISEYHSQSQPLGDRLSGGFVASINVLNRMIDALESYLTMAPPTTSAPPAPATATSDGLDEARSTAATSVAMPAAEARDKPEETKAGPSSDGEGEEAPAAGPGPGDPDRS
jgi:hypothetical protein